MEGILNKMFMEKKIKRREHPTYTCQGDSPEIQKKHIEGRCYFSNSAIRSAWFAT
jgi:hypothetical protein